MPVSGTYKYEKGENIEGFLVAIVEAKGKETSHNTLTIGSPSTFTFGTGFEIEVTLTVSGNVAKGLIKKGDRKGELTIEYSDPGTLTETFNIDGNVAKKIYKKV
ncbi:hypothetical protein Avbf_13398 [Armadillidium vulgare]|nr:hypothetical protein Avbf_13401 [Armadillidium vulgare]RXG57791.1 hypothetical protein Avbf_13398 [Armadillidium vulgare]